MLILPGKSASWSSGGGLLTYLGTDGAAAAATTTVTFSSKTLGTGEIWLAVYYLNSSASLSGITVDGNATSIATDGVTSANAEEVSVFSQIRYASVSAATGDIVCTFSGTTESWAGIGLSWYLVQGRTSIDDVTVFDPGGTDVTPTADITNLDVTAAAGGAVIATGNADYVTGDWSTTGVTIDGQSNYRGNMRGFGASATGLSSGTLAITGSAPISTGTRTVGVSVAIS